MGLIDYIVKRNRHVSGTVLKELALAGDLNTEVGEAVIEIMKVYEREPDNQDIIYRYVKRLYNNYPLSPIDNPKISGEYIDHGYGHLQACRYLNLCSRDNGESWYDIMHHSKFEWLFKFFKGLISDDTYKKHVLGYVEFPYYPKMR